MNDAKIISKFFNNLNMNKITINGKTITSSGDISIVNNKVIIDGKDVTPDSKEINISIEGNIGTLNASGCNTITVSGDVTELKTTSGDVEVGGDVTGDINTTSGDVKCGRVSGDVTTVSGNIRHK